ERPRSGREPERHRRGARPVHGRPLTARPADRTRHRRGARPAAHPARGARPGGPLPRHRQAARPGRRADEARPAVTGRVRRDQAAPSPGQLGARHSRLVSASMAGEAILGLYRREITPALYAEIRDLYKRHSIAEDARDLPGLISTLTPDCVYELVQTGHRWE